MAAEEWGVVDSKYDWSTGAYEQVFTAHPEWQGKVIADLNFELPAHAHGRKAAVRCTYEYADFMEHFTEAVVVDEEAYPDGAQDVYKRQLLYSGRLYSSPSGEMGEICRNALSQEAGRRGCGLPGSGLFGFNCLRTARGRSFYCLLYTSLRIDFPLFFDIIRKNYFYVHAGSQTG